MATPLALTQPQPSNRLLETFFKEKKSAPKSKQASGSSASIARAAVDSDIFNLPVSSDLRKLTRSERLFSVATQVDIRSLTISGDSEFYLFMEMRAERKWASFRMNSHKWVVETDEYNKRLEAKNQQSSLSTVKKNPRALLEKLIAIEAAVLRRLATQNFTCKFTSAALCPR